MRLRQYLNESINNKVQKAVDMLSKEYKVQSIPIKFTNKQLTKGPAYYSSIRYKGSKKIIPQSITIGEWQSVQNYPDEWLYILGHELAHHILSQTELSLRHTKKHETLARTLESKLKKALDIKPKISSKELNKIKDKLDYWLDPVNKMELIDIHGQKNYDNQIKAWQDKIG